MKAYILGAGGHAKVVISCLRDLSYEVVAAFDDDEKQQNRSILGVPVAGPLERIEEYPRYPTVIAIGENCARYSIAHRFNLDWLSTIHPNASIDTTVRIGRVAVVVRGAVIQADSRLGNHVIVNTAASIDHDCVIGDFAHIGPGAHLAGNVTLGKGSFLGIGASAIPQVRIGAWTTVGAGGAVVRDLPEHVIAIGVPARISRKKQGKLGPEIQECDKCD